jgi:uncharacterized SAM-binding protein YcdF (DUF218 family)
VRVSWLFIAGIVSLMLLILVQRSGRFLVVQQLQKADVIVVLAGDLNDRRYWTGIQLLQGDYGRELFVDAVDTTVIFGHSYADWARQFVGETTSGPPFQVRVCPIREDSTVGETKYVRECLRGENVKTVLLVTSDYHTRRALSIFQTRLPEYRWHVAAASDPTQFGTRWWQHRQWAKRAAEEWEKLLWWEFVERWL